MTWFAVDEDGTEVAFGSKPQRDYHSVKGHFWNEHDIDISKNSWGRVELPQGSIFTLTSQNLIWEDEPIELK